MAYDRRALVGIGGWLAFLILTLCLNAIATLLVPLGVMASPDAAARFGGGAWTNYLGVTWLLAAVKCSGYGYLAWLLNARHEPETPRRVIIGLWTLALVPPLLDGLSGAILLSIPARQAGILVGQGMFRPIVYAAIWTAYLLRSQRIANTYTPGKRDDEVLTAVFD